MTTTLERAARAARKEIDKLRKTQVPEYPGSWKTHNGLGWENLDDVVVATTRAVLMAVREPDEVVSDEGWAGMAGEETSWSWSDYERPQNHAFAAMIDAILNEEKTND